MEHGKVGPAVRDPAVLRGGVGAPPSAVRGPLAPPLHGRHLSVARQLVMPLAAPWPAVTSPPSPNRPLRVQVHRAPVVHAVNCAAVGRSASSAASVVRRSLVRRMPASAQCVAPAPSAGCFWHRSQCVRDDARSAGEIEGLEETGLLAGAVVLLNGFLCAVSPFKEE